MFETVKEIYFPTARVYGTRRTAHTYTKRYIWKSLRDTHTNPAQREESLGNKYVGERLLAFPTYPPTIFAITRLAGFTNTGFRVLIPQLSPELTTITYLFPNIYRHIFLPNVLPNLSHDFCDVIHLFFPIPFTKLFPNLATTLFPDILLVDDWKMAEELGKGGRLDCQNSGRTPFWEAAMHEPLILCITLPLCRYPHWSYK
jgi:hypothetical protein